MQKREKKWQYLYSHKRRTILVLSILIFIIMYLVENATFLVRTASAILFIAAFYFVDHFFDIKFKARHYAFIFIFVIAGMLLSPLYFTYPQYDKVQHLLLPIMLCSIVYHMTSKLTIEYKWKLTFAVLSTIAILGIFEIGEYVLDIFFDYKLQGVYLRDLSGLQKFHLIQDPIDDTMIDLTFGILGACIYAISHLKYFKK